MHNPACGSAYLRVPRRVLSILSEPPYQRHRTIFQKRFTTLTIARSANLEREGDTPAIPAVCSSHPSFWKATPVKVQPALASFYDAG
jgi:hypothetical protein